MAAILAAFLMSTGVYGLQSYSVRQTANGGLSATVNSTTIATARKGALVSTTVGGDSKPAAGFGDELNHDAAAYTFNVSGPVVAYSGITKAYKVIIPNGPSVESVCYCSDQSLPTPTGWNVVSEDVAIASLVSASMTSQGCATGQSRVYTQVKFTAAESVSLYSLNGVPNMYSIEYADGNSTETATLGSGSRAEIAGRNGVIRLADSVPSDWVVNGYLYSTENEKFLLSLTSDRSFSTPYWWSVTDGIVHLPTITELAAVLTTGPYAECRGTVNTVVPTTFEGNIYARPENGVESETSVAIPVAATALSGAQGLRVALESYVEVDLSDKVEEVSYVTKNGNKFTLHSTGVGPYAYCRENPCLGCHGTLISITGPTQEFEADVPGLACNTGSALRLSVDITPAPASRMLREERSLALAPPAGGDFTEKNNPDSDASVGIAVGVSIAALVVLAAIFVRREGGRFVCRNPCRSQQASLQASPTQSGRLGKLTL